MRGADRPHEMEEDRCEVVLHMSIAEGQKSYEEHSANEEEAIEDELRQTLDFSREAEYVTVAIVWFQKALADMFEMREQADAWWEHKLASRKTEIGLAAYYGEGWYTGLEIGRSTFSTDIKHLIKVVDEKSLGKGGAPTIENLNLAAAAAAEFANLTQASAARTTALDMIGTAMSADTKAPQKSLQPSEKVRNAKKVPTCHADLTLANLGFGPDQESGPC